MHTQDTFMGKAQGLGLYMLTQFASSDIADRLKIRKPIEGLLYQGSKTGFQIATQAARIFTPAKSSGKATRLPSQKRNNLFDLTLTDEQQMTRDSLSRFAKEVLRPAAHAADEAHGISADVQTQASELGLMYYAVPESLGGAATEDSLVTQMLALEDLGHGDFSLAAAIYAPVSVANVLTRYGTDAQQRQYLPAFIDETKPAIAALACNEPSVVFDPYKLQTTARAEGDSYVLNGEKSLVLLAADSELFIISAQLDGQPALFIVESGLTGLTLSEEPAMGLKAAKTARLHLKNVRTPKANLLTEANYREFLDLGALASCAVAVGTAQAVLDYVAVYANEREAFGEPISHRQSVAFMIADMAIEVDAMRLLTWSACSLAEAGKPFHREAHLARILCSEKAMKIGTDGVQLLGGHGFTKEHPVERWYRDLRSVAITQNAISL
ncbi:acyl-CoA dehydrogenase family protein [Aquirhabdus parva]|nr:acyl-CoA dehydrogenase family protein [Aquirhabdus parva]